MSLHLSQQEWYIIQSAAIAWTLFQCYGIAKELYETRQLKKSEHKDCPNCGEHPVQPEAPEQGEVGIEVPT